VSCLLTGFSAAHRVSLHSSLWVVRGYRVRKIDVERFKRREDR
jgi:hypothetical protein